jgi:predicted DNA-binding transcriptional regulator AlpA
MSDVKRDEQGRPLAEDGWPMSGLARIPEAVAASGLSRSKLYAEIRAGRLATKVFGRSRRIPWSEVRRAFLSDAGGAQ